MPSYLASAVSECKLLYDMDTLGAKEGHFLVLLTMDSQSDSKAQRQHLLPSDPRKIADPQAWAAFRQDVHNLTLPPWEMRMNEHLTLRSSTFALS